MPTYEYECTKCSNHFEVFQAITDEPVKKCPKCGKAVRRLILGGAGVIFKGSGFYVTDKAAKTGTKAGKSSSDAAASASETKTTENAVAKDTAAKDTAANGAASGASSSVSDSGGSDSGKKSGKNLSRPAGKSG